MEVVFLIIVSAIALISASLSTHWVPLKAQPNRCLEGLRGFLAIFVFVHHGAVWRNWLDVGRWAAPPHSALPYLGSASVSMFFMITAFLFVSRIRQEREKGIDWLTFAIGRTARLAPLFGVVSIAVILLAFAATGFTLREPLGRVAAEIASWPLLGVFGMPDVNSHPNTGQAIAYVAWSLRYEVLFYAALPLLALMMGHRLRWVTLAIGGLIVVVTYLQGISGALLIGFLPGIAAAYLADLKAVSGFSRSKIGSILAVVGMAVGIYLAGPRFSPASFLSLAIAFILIANGADLLGLLRGKASQLLGQISYGVYLLHGLLLYLVLGLVGYEPARAFDPVLHWVLVAALGFWLVLAASVAHVLIERPSIRWGKRLAGGISEILVRRSSRSTSHELDPSPSALR